MSFPPAPLCCSLKHEHKRTPPSQFQGTAEFLFQRFHIAGHKVGIVPAADGNGFACVPRVRVSHSTRVTWDRLTRQLKWLRQKS